MEELSNGTESFDDLIGNELRNQRLGHSALDENSDILLDIKDFNWALPFALESTSDSEKFDATIDASKSTDNSDEDTKSEIPSVNEYLSDTGEFRYKFNLCDQTGLLSKPTGKECSSVRTHLVELGETKRIVNQASTSSSNSLCEDTSRGESLKRGKQSIYDKYSKRVKFRTAGTTHEFDANQISPYKDLANSRNLSSLIGARLLPQNSINQRYTISNPSAKVNIQGMKASSYTGQRLFSSENLQCTVRNLKPVLPEYKSDISINSTNSSLVEFSHRFVLQANPAFKSCKLYIKQLDTTTCSKCQHLPSQCICAQCLVEVKSTILYQLKRIEHDTDDKP